MDDMEQDSEWDTEEFQAALKTVLKYEIQSLLERLSQTGEETVLLAVNTVDMCVSHLASSNVQKFVNSVDVGQIKTKFLHFVSGEPPGAMGLSKPPIKSDLDCGAYSDSEINSQARFGNAGNSSKFAGKRGHDVDPPAQENQTAAQKRRKLEENATQNHPQFRKNVNVSSTVSASVTSKNSGDLAKLPLRSGSSDEDNTHDKLNTANKADIQGKKDIKLNTTKIVSKSGGFTEERLSDTEFKNLLKLCNSDVEKEVGGLPRPKTFSPGGKLQQQQQLHQQQRDFGRGINSKMTSTPNPSVVGTRAVPELKSQPLSKQSDLKPKTDSKSEKDKNTKFDKTAGVGNRLRNSATTDFSKEDGGSVRKPGFPSISGKENDMSQIKISPLLNMPEIKEELDPDDTAYRQSEQNKSTIPPTSQDKQQIVPGGRLGNQPVQGKDNRADVPPMLNTKDVKPNTQAIIPQKVQRPVNEDDLDTETLIRMAKEKHKETQSDADKAIQAKLGQLSSKLSWVVEYPKDKQQQESSWKPYPGEITQTRHILGNVYTGNPMLDEEDEDEEDYEDGDYEDELDEEEIEALKALHANKLLRLRQGAMQGYPNEGEYEGEMGAMGYGEYGDEEEGDYEGYEEYDPEEMEGEEEDGGMMGHMGGNFQHHMQHGGNMGAFSDGGMGSFGEGGSQGMSQNQQYQEDSSPAFANFIITGFMAKCLVCNKIIRKTEMTQHNQMHLDEEEEEEGHFEEEGEEHWDEEEGGDEEEYNEEDMIPLGDGNMQTEDEGNMLSQQGEGEMLAQGGGDVYTQGDGNGFPQGGGDELSQEGEDYEGGDPVEGQEQFEGESEPAAEFFAEKFVAEKVTVSDSDVSSAASDKPKKSTVCDVCNKQFKSVGNMQRHRKTHTEQNKYPCQLCDKTFRSTGTLLAHTKKKHPNTNPGLREESVENVFQCGVCSETFTEENSLQEHMKSHRDTEW